MENRRKGNRWFLWLALLAAFFFFGSCFSEITTEEPSAQKEPVKQEEIKPKPKPAQPSAEDKYHDDPLSSSFTSSSYLFDSDLRNMLSGSKLEYCSHIEKGDGYDLLVTWNLKSSEKEVYRCEYSYDKQRKNYDAKSIVSCEVSDGYEDYQNGDTDLIRDYVMPEKDDRIDMFVYPKSSDYYGKYFILGKYSDMNCSVQGDDIFFEYLWYQKTDEGPVLVYKSTATNTTTTSGQRYHEELWELFEQSYKNIDIIPYEEYPRDRDYYEVYEEWKKKDQKKKAEANLKERIEVYCACQDEEDLYSAYTDDFDSWEDAYDFWEENCE